MKCLTTDVVYPGIAEELKEFMDVKTSDEKPLSREEMIHEIVDVDMLIMCIDSRIDRDVLDAVKNLKTIGACAVDLNHVDLECAKEKGTQVFNTPGLSINAVAKLTVSKMLDISRYTIPANQDVKVNHIWDKYKYTDRELRNKTLDMIGFGRISRRAAELAKAFGMTTVVYDPFLKPEDFEREDAKGMGIDELIEVSDFISLHVPLTPETKDFFNKKSIAEMKDGTVVPNMSHGGIANEQDIYEVLYAGRAGGCAADAVESELAGNGLNGNNEFQSPLFSCDSFVIGPRIGAQTVDASRDIGFHIVEKVKEVIDLK